jgi:hypothetical protein
MPQGLYTYAVDADTPDDDNNGTAKPSAWSVIKRPLMAWAAASAAAALLAGTGFVDAATAFDGGAGATVGIIAAANLMPKSTVAQWALPIAVPALVGMQLDGVVVGTGLVATMVYRNQMI